MIVPVFILESDCRATNTTPTHTISSKNQSKFEIDILLNVVERSGNFVFEDETLPTALRERVVSCDLEVYKVDIERVIVWALKGLIGMQNTSFSAIFVIQVMGVWIPPIPLTSQKYI